MRKFKTWRDPYDLGYSTCRPREIEIQEGVTVLVGCNGIGKTTLINNIHEVLKENNIPVKLFNNLENVGEFSTNHAFASGDFGLASALIESSEGEKISIKLTLLAKNLYKFVRTGIYTKSTSKVEKALKSLQENARDSRTEVFDSSNERWVLLDATDSGYSIDNVIELKEFFNLMIEDAKSENVELYIVISANEFELADKEQCFDVARGKYITFKDYDDYKQFILDTRQLKDRRITQAEAKLKNEKWRSNHSED